MKISAILLMLFLAVMPSAYADIVFFSGMEYGNTGEFSTSGGTPTFSSVIKHSGTYSLRINPTTTGTMHAVLEAFNSQGVQNNGLGNPATACIQFYFYVATAPAANDEEIYSIDSSGGAGDKFYLRLNSSRQLVAYDSTVALLATGSTALDLNAWHKIVACTGTGAAATYTVYLNGLVELTGTGNLRTQFNRRVFLGKPNNRNGNTVDFYYDDLVAENTSSLPNGTAVIMLKPDANGATMQWTAGSNASDYQEVDDATPDGDTTYIESTANGDVALFSLVNTSTAGIYGQVFGAKMDAFAYEVSADATSNFNLRMVSGATTLDTTANNISTGTTYVHRGRILTTDPATSSAWTMSALDAVQIGVVEVTGSSRLRATSVGLHVLFGQTTFNGINRPDIQSINGVAAGSIQSVNGNAF